MATVLLAASDSAMYSLSAELNATIRCLLDLHEIVPPARREQYPVTDLLDFVSLFQLASTKVIKSKPFPGK